MLLDSAISDLTSEKGVFHLMPANPSGSELDLKLEVDFCEHPRMPTVNDKRTIHYPEFFILGISVVCQAFVAFFL